MFGLLFLVACGKEKSKTSGMQEQANVEERVRSLDTYHYSDTVSMGGHAYVYTLDRQTDDSLRMVKEESGEQWKDNFYRLTIVRDGVPFFERRITKTTLGGLLPEDFRVNGILDGFRFVRAEKGRLCFSLCVSYPNSDMSAPFQLIIAADGSSAFEMDNINDMEEMGDTANF